MKLRAFFLSVCVSILCSGYAQYDIHFEDLSLQQALAKSATENKPVFFMGYATWCAHCEKMMKDVFTDSSVANYFNAHFICLKQDMESGDGISLSDKFGVVSFPTFVFMDGTGEVLYQVVGEFKAPDMITQGKTSFILEKQLPYLKQQFENNPGDSTACYTYLQGLGRARLNAMPVVNQYFALHKNDFEFNSINWRILNLSVSDIESEEFDFMVQHRKEFDDAVTAVKVDRKLFRTAAYNLQTPANTNDTATYNRKKAIAEQLHIYSVDSIIFALDLNLYERNKNWSKYSTTAIAGAEKYQWTNYSELKHIAEAINSNSTDIKSLKSAAAFAKQSAALHAEYGNTLLYAKLLFKCDDKKGALEAAQSAKTIAAQTQSDASEADLIIRQCGGGN